MLVSLLSTNPPSRPQTPIRNPTLQIRVVKPLMIPFDGRFPILSVMGKRGLRDINVCLAIRFHSCCGGLSAADEQGYAIDRPRLKKWRAWSIDIRSFVKPDHKDDLKTASTVAAKIDTLNALLLGIPARTEADKMGKINPAPWLQNSVDALPEDQVENGD